MRTPDMLEVLSAVERMRANKQRKDLLSPPLIFDISTVPDFANDGAAAGGGVLVGGVYRNGSVLMIRAA